MARPEGVISSTESDTAQMWALWVRGVTQQQIADRFGITQPAVCLRLKKYRRDLPETEREMIFRRELDLLDDLRRQTLVIFNDTTLDPTVRLGAADRVMKGMERLAKMMGLDSPDKVDMEVSSIVIKGVPDEALS